MPPIAHRRDVNPQSGEQQYGDVRFADPTNHKYPINTPGHVRAAWSYINQPHSAGKYSPEDVARIKSRIRAAMAKRGIA